MRLSEYDGNDEYANLAYGRWEHNVRAALAGKRGQKALREIEQALLALPNKRLVSDEFMIAEVVGDGPVAVVEADYCVLGAYARWKGIDQDELYLEADCLDWSDATPLWAVENLGMTFTLACTLVEANDDNWRDRTPEQRYEDVLAWVRREITPVLL